MRQVFLIILIIQMRKLRCREVEELTKGYMQRLYVLELVLEPSHPGPGVPALKRHCTLWPCNSECVSSRHKNNHPSSSCPKVQFMCFEQYLNTRFQFNELL